MGLLTQLLVAMLSGTVAYLLVGIVLGVIPSRRVREAVGSWYLAEAMLLLGRALLVKRTHGGFVLKGSRYDGREKIHLGGDVKRFADESNGMSRLFASPFGLVHEKADQIFTPFDADVGGTRRRKSRGGDMTWSEGGITRYLGVFAWETRDPAIVDMDDALDLTQGSAKPTNVETAKTLMEIAKSAFNSERFVDDMKFIVAFGTGFGAMLIASKVASTSAGSGVSVPSVPITVMLGLAVIPAGPSFRDILDGLAREDLQRELRDLAQLCLGAAAGITLVWFWVDARICTQAFYLNPDAPCLVVQEWVNQVVVLAGGLSVVAIGGLITGRLREQRALPIGGDPDPEVSD